VLLETMSNPFTESTKENFEWMDEHKPKWMDKEYRQAYMEATVGSNIPMQVHYIRKHRGLSRKQLAKMIGVSKKDIRKFEDNWWMLTDVNTLLKIANAFDCALMVKFVPYSKLAEDVRNMSIHDFEVVAYRDEAIVHDTYEPVTR
jgi:ribosome-binding protein aMBF1 (putative translation factor)